MSIVGVNVENVSKRLKTQRLKALSDAARPNLSHEDDALAANANFTIGQCLLEQGKVGQAVEYLKTAALKARQNAQYLCLLAKAELMLRNDAQAQKAAQSALDACTDTDAHTLNILGYVFSRLGNHQTALGLFECAVSLAPNIIEFRDNLVRTYVFFGRKEEAIIQFEAILKLNPAHGKAHLGMAELKTWTKESNHIPRLTKALTQTKSKIEQIRIRFALAKECEDLNRSNDAFDHLYAANKDFFVSAKFDIQNDLQLMQSFQDIYTDQLKQQQSSIEEGPLFVVGIPRTGTTLVDRILTAHPRVDGAGELQSMPLAVKQASKTHSKIVLDLETIQKAGNAFIEDVGRAYIENARLYSHVQNSSVFTDKLPLNFLYAGFILKALPRAKMVCLRRNPMDTVWSNYKHLFAGGARYHTYSYDLMSIAKFYLGYLKITQFWQQEFPDRFLIVDYENIVADQKAQTSKLLSHCGLNWEEGCLDFHTSTKAVATPSASQVRQPLYNNSIGKWKRYADQLEPVRAFFEEKGVDV
ncbi:tetratricopeptide repeat-containing sulfotransferase family protein [Hirschia litorea]|uniref:Tetratricopeptide repeat-containing sulfotransferase family protein n=1 Tax=Hirschia litorea TaxID=1199156 RepID=A0ABW2IQ70_9PROT